jgi:hypothetical protein
MANHSDNNAPPSAAIDRREDKRGGPGRPGRAKVTSWFVPPIVVLTFLVALIVARAAYLAFV